MIKAGNLAGFEVTYGDTGLFVMATISQITNSGLVSLSTVVMQEDLPGTYWGFFTPAYGVELCYLIEIHAYTDGTYTTIDNNYAGSSRSETSVILGENIVGAAHLEGFVEPLEDICVSIESLDGIGI